MSASGYTHCACRDCSAIVVSDDVADPNFCAECIECGCEHDEDCSRPDAYGVGEEGDE